MTSLTERVMTTRSKLADGARWDLIVVGAGITGAGIAREASRRGWSTLVLESRDFAGGTSNFSSKMIHGGLRYLAQGHWRLTRQAAQAREQLMRRWPDLITPLPYILLHHPHRGPKPLSMKLALWVYYFLSGAQPFHRPRFYSEQKLAAALPQLQLAPNLGASHYFDASCDDSLLVLRTLEEAVAQGADLSHYTRVEKIHRDEHGVCGLTASYQDKTVNLATRMVINATGVWSDGLAALPKGYSLRPLRGSHLMFRWSDIPVLAAMTLFHPRDQRLVFCYPWQGTTVLGTTDLDHSTDKELTPRITQQERDYLLEILPMLGIQQRPQPLSSWSGLRPIMAKADKQQAPSDASREHMIWSEPGLVNVTGGKLTTFAEMADEVLDRADEQQRLPACNAKEEIIIQRHHPIGQDLIGSSLTSRAELNYWAQHGAIEHLEDLLLRRTRLGWVLGAQLKEYEAEIQSLCEPLLNWGSTRWSAEWEAFWRYWQQVHCEQTPASRQGAKSGDS